ncbi:uncharacterized protein METZ01_LOCUS138314 [marine metagenome]|uniref:Uncharacterized protein n=1 Tax=marine metagenome TaxID=408172 RepID=A0A381Z892_9ZZZZ|tara:strand:+ start:337 stop:594 length:258 start_codon:yes stop_codon:yes gene_type:complete
MRKMIFKNYLKDPISTIAVNTTIFIAGCLFFGSIALIGIMSDIFSDNQNPVRNQHIIQHSNEQVQYDKMINLLDSINSKLDKQKN